MKNYKNKMLSVIFMVNSLKIIFGNDLRTILLKGFGIDVKKIKRISILENEFYILKNFYESETENYRKKLRKYHHYEKVLRKTKTKLIIKNVTDVISINEWEGAISTNDSNSAHWSDKIGLFSNNGECYVNFG